MVRKSFFILLISSLFSVQGYSQADEEQENLQLCYDYSRLLGCQLETIPDPPLFKTIYDWLGTPYRYSGDSEKGIDCSGFVCRIYKTVFGIELAESSADIYKQVKTRKKGAMEIGDLVFFRIDKHRVSHVGIYIGYNKFAHASVQGGVMVSDLDEPYYRKYFYKGGRVKDSLLAK